MRWIKNGWCLNIYTSLTSCKLGCVYASGIFYATSLSKEAWYVCTREKKVKADDWSLVYLRYIPFCCYYNTTFLCSDRKAYETLAFSHSLFFNTLLLVAAGLLLIYRLFILFMAMRKSRNSILYVKTLSKGKINQIFFLSLVCSVTS